MCGIGLLHIKDMTRSRGIDLDKAADAMLLELQTRGYDATGYVAVTEDGEAYCQKAACEASTFIRHRHLFPRGTRTVLLHTRAATQGHHAFPENNHPIRRGSFYIVHNGHVFNDAELFRLAQRERYGEVDSEAIAALMAHYDSLNHAGALVGEIEGDAAVAMVDTRKPGRATLVRGSTSPLHILSTRRMFIAASTATACETAHRAGIGSLGRARTEWIDEGTVLQLHGDRLKRTTVDVPWSWASANWKHNVCEIPPAQGWSNTPKTDNSVTTKLGDKLASALSAKWTEHATRCDICGIVCDDYVDRHDGYDTWEVCHPCAEEWREMLHPV